MRRTSAVTATSALAVAALTGLSVAHTDTPTAGTPDPAVMHAAAVATASPNIVGGHPATQNYPWIVSLEVNAHGDPDFHRCTASLFSPNKVQTNAHCVTNADGTAMDPALFHVRIGSPDRRAGEVFTISHIDVVDGWHWGIPDADGYTDDEAMLTLTGYTSGQPLEVNPHTAPAGTHVREIGWGRIDGTNTGPAAQNLQELDSTVITSSACDTNPDFPIGRGELCVDNPNGSDGQCGGDSGSPLPSMIDGRWQDRGGSSRSAGMVPGCGGEPDVYTDRAAFRPWAAAIGRGQDSKTAMTYLLKSRNTRAEHGPGPQAVSKASTARSTASMAWAHASALTS